MNRTIDREDIFAAARASEFKRIEACCEGVPLKACSNDVWKGDIVALVAELERRGGFGWQQAATWLCQHHHEFADMGSLVKAMREAAPAAHNAETQEPVAWMRDAGEDSISTMTCCCTDAVKQLWLKVNPEQVERYTIPLYAHPQPITDAAWCAAYAKLRQPFARPPYEALTSIPLRGAWSDARERLAYAGRVAETVTRSCEIQLQQRLAEIERLDRAKGE